MNAAQKGLVEKSLGVVGWTLVAALVLVLIAGFVDRGGWFLEDIFDADRAALIIWPLLVVSVSLLWARAFIRAGR